MSLIALPEWSTACPDWERRIVAGESLIPFPPLFPGEATANLAVFDALRVVDMPGSPTMGEIARPWVRDFAAAVFGSYDAETGRRLIREYLLLVSKKNTKSTLAADVMLTALVRNWRPSGEFSIIAPTVEIANNSFFPARDAIKADNELDELLQVSDHTRTITHRITKATLKVLAADSDTVGGKKSIGTFIDELWLFGKRPGAENMFREALGGMASRPEGFVIYATTQSDEPPAGVFKQKLDYARGVRDGTINDKRFLPVLYEFPAAMLAAGEHRNTKNFYITNPNLGASVDVEFLEREYAKAQITGEGSVRGFLSKHLNVEIGLSMRTDNWAGAEYWEACAEPGLTLESLLERCEVVVVGIDGGGLDDLLGMAVIGRETETGLWLQWEHAWVHPIALERRKTEAPRYRDFAKEGTLTIVDYIGQDVEQVAARVRQCEDAGVLDRIGVDTAGIGSVVDAIVAVDIDPERIVGIPQGWKLTGAIKTVERKAAEGALRHAGSAMMAWSVGNAKVEPRGNAVIITKQASGTGKIDPVLAMMNAGALMAMNPKSRRKSFEMFFV